MLADILPNAAILKNPHNWFLVAFSLILLIFASHLLFKD